MERGIRGAWQPLFMGTTPHSLKTLTSLNKEARPFFLGDKALGVFPLFQIPLDAITALWEVQPKVILELATIAFGEFEIIVPKYYYRLGKMEFKESSLLI